MYKNWVVTQSSYITSLLSAMSRILPINKEKVVMELERSMQLVLTSPWVYSCSWSMCVVAENYRHTGGRSMTREEMDALTLNLQWTEKLGSREC